MGKVYDSITDEFVAWIGCQKFFMVGTAPRVGGHVNMSPKGYDSFRILSPNRVAYVDLVGSGNETAAHILDNRRITFMFMSFDKGARILRLYGEGEVIHREDPAYTEMLRHFPDMPGIRQIIAADIHRVQTACGYSVPRYELVEERDALLQWEDLLERKGGKEAYIVDMNRKSIDGLPTGIESRTAS